VENQTFKQTSEFARVKIVGHTDYDLIAAWFSLSVLKCRCHFGLIALLALLEPCGLARNAARRLRISLTRAGNAQLSRSKPRHRLWYRAEVGFSSFWASYLNWF
jgi:hypothetical protein